MNNDGTPPGQMVDFSSRFAGSKLFHQVFQEGMALVEETAHYLDGDGRAQSRGLSKPVALTYATESMRLTTRLMQVASWLLIQRAIADGEMPASEAYSESGRVPLKPPAMRHERQTDDALPEKLRELMERTDRIYARLYRLDVMLDPAEATDTGTPNKVVDQIDQLRAAFDPGGDERQ